MKYQDYLKSDDWKQKRIEKLRKTQRCAICLSAKNLDIHHVFYRNLTDVTTSDLRVLCRRCHTLAHKLHKEKVFTFRKENDNHHSRFERTKGAVRKYLGLTKKPSLNSNQQHLMLD